LTNVSHTALTPLSFLERSVRVWADKIAVEDGPGTLTYAELGELAQRFGRALAGSGVRRGDRVAALMPNVAEMLMAHFAVPLAGAVLVAINTRLSVDEIRYIIEHSGSSVIVIHPSLLETARKALAGLTEIECVVTGPAVNPAPATEHLTWQQFLDRADDVAPLPWAVNDENAPISINYTSGTTGRPQGVVYTHRGAYLNSLGELIHSRHTADSVYLWTLPMFHCNGWCTVWALTAIGGTHVCLAEVRGDAVWESLRRHGVTHLNAAPTAITTILNAAEASPLDSPVTVTTAGAPPSPTTIRQLKEMGFHLVHVYGLTETYGP
jgi:fatty-acyl-CoA synthase